MKYPTKEELKWLNSWGMEKCKKCLHHRFVHDEGTCCDLPSGCLIEKCNCKEFKKRHQP